MNLVEKLLKIEKGEYTAEQTMRLKSPRLSKLTGEDVQVVIKELGQQQYLDLAALNLDADGNPDTGKAFDTNAKIVATALIEPDVKNPDLLKHLGVATPADAVKVLFRGETRILADKVGELCGYGEDVEKQVEVIKNL